MSPCLRVREGVHMVAGVSYEKVDDEGLHVTVDGEPRLLEVDNVIVCAGQEPLNDLQVTAWRWSWSVPDTAPSVMTPSVILDYWSVGVPDTWGLIEISPTGHMSCP